MSSLAVNVSSIISSLCYSIFRIEPYTTCTYNCTYCYGRWYRPLNHTIPKPQYGLVLEFSRVARKLSRLRLETIPFRLSTLIEPFQPVEEEYKLSLRILKLALSNNIPLIISTKSTLLMSGEWFKVLTDLASKGIVLLQITIVTLNEKLRRILEPKAPTVEDRVNAIDIAQSTGIPVVIRYQPLIPGIVEYEVQDVLKLARELKVKHVILEFLRCTTSELEFYKGIAYSKEAYSIIWESYSPVRSESNIVRPPLTYRLKVLNTILKLARNYNVKIALCKEGLFNYDQISDCCGITYLNNTRLRLTLKEAWNMLREGYSYTNYTLLLKHYESKWKYVTSLNARVYPRMLRKPIIHHERVLKSVLESNYLNRITPLLELRGGRVYSTQTLHF